MSKEGYGYLSVCGDGEEGLLAADELDGPQCGERLARRGQLHLGAVDAAQLPAVVVAPPVDGARAAPRQRPE